MNKDEKRALGSAALHRKELRRKRLLASAAHSPDDMGTRQLRQLPVFIGSIHLLNCQCLIEFKKLSA